MTLHLIKLANYTREKLHSLRKFDYILQPHYTIFLHLGRSFRLWRWIFLCQSFSNFIQKFKYPESPAIYEIYHTYHLKRLLKIPTHLVVSQLLAMIRLLQSCLSGVSDRSHTAVPGNARGFLTKS